ncbi:unnamed protein product [Schistosoma guineensis]|nr:unnamed protein product [Schistosoma guineensis]
MRQTFSSVQLIPIYSVIVLISTFFDCYNICEDSRPNSYNVIVSEDDTHKYTKFSTYMQKIRVDQPPPYLPERFKHLDTDQEIDPRFRFKFNNNSVKKFRVKFTGAIDLLGPHYLGTIRTFLNGRYWSESEILNEDQPFKVITVIHSNGKISIFYDEIPQDLGKYKIESIIEGATVCKRGGKKYKKTFKINVPEKWIKSGTLVEYE